MPSVICVIAYYEWCRRVRWCVVLPAALWKLMTSNWRNVLLANLFDIVALNVRRKIDRSTSDSARRERLSFVTRYYSSSLREHVSQGLSYLCLPLHFLHVVLQHANQMREWDDSLEKKKWPFCRHPLPKKKRIRIPLPWKEQKQMIHSQCQCVKWENTERRIQMCVKIRQIASASKWSWCCEGWEKGIAPFRKGCYIMWKYRCQAQSWIYTS